MCTLILFSFTFELPWTTKKHRTKIPALLAKKKIAAAIFKKRVSHVWGYENLHIATPYTVANCTVLDPAFVLVRYLGDSKVSDHGCRSHSQKLKIFCRVLVPHVRKGYGEFVPSHSLWVANWHHSRSCFLQGRNHIVWGRGFFATEVFSLLGFFDVSFKFNAPYDKVGLKINPAWCTIERCKMYTPVHLSTTSDIFSSRSESSLGSLSLFKLDRKSPYSGYSYQIGMNYFYGKDYNLELWIIN